MPWLLVVLLLCVSAVLLIEATTVGSDEFDEGFGGVDGSQDLSCEAEKQPKDGFYFYQRYHGDGQDQNEVASEGQDEGKLQLGMEQSVAEDAPPDLKKMVEESYNKQVEYIWFEVHDDPVLAGVVSQCINRHRYCTQWAVEGRCDVEEQRPYMYENCPLACYACDMLVFKNRLNMGVQQSLGEDAHHLQEQFDNSFSKQRNYLHAEVQDDPLLVGLLPRCVNHHKSCTQWALEGRCNVEKAKPQMYNECPLACYACDMLIYEKRCPKDWDAERAWRAGDLNKMFERIVTNEKYKPYKPRVWSRPALKQEGANAEQLGITQQNPWIVSMENFLSDEEADRIVELGYDDGFRMSDDGGEYLSDGTFQAYIIPGRTSFNAWCMECHDDPLGQAVLDRMEDVTRIPKRHFENLQVLRYREGQHYHTHHDFDDWPLRQPGPRIMTFFLYLSDVEEGGGTDFPLLNLTFTPKKGMAVMWPNVLDEDPERWDKRTTHQALPVIKGTKYAANAWIHQHDWQGPASRNCAE